MSIPVGCPHEYPGNCSHPDCGCWTTVLPSTVVQSIPRNSPLAAHMRTLFTPEETTMAREDHEDLKNKAAEFQAPLGGKPYRTDLHHTNSDAGPMTTSTRPLAEAVSDDDVQFRLALTRSLQIDIDNMYRLRRTWAREDRQAAGTLRTMADRHCHAEDHRTYLRLAARKLDELATAEEAPPRIFALTDRDGTKVEITGVTSPDGQIQASLVLRRAAELGAFRVSSFLTTLNTPLVEFPDPPVRRSVRPRSLTDGPLVPAEEPPTLAERIEATVSEPRPAPTQGDIDGLEQSQAFLQTQLAQAEQALRALVAAVTPLQVNGHDLTALDARLSTAVESAKELLAEYEPTDLATRRPRY